MRIALLNLPLDNNYGGFLQRYALIRVLTAMGHSVTHIYLVNDTRLTVLKRAELISKGVVLKYILHKTESVNERIKKNIQYQQKLEQVQPFYVRTINHTSICYNLDDVRRVCNEGYDAFIVGSDQVWRKDMTHSIGWQSFLFEFLNNKQDVKRIAYGISFGKNTVSYSKEEQKEFSKLYSRFDAVSVREDSALTVLKQMGCVCPIPQQVIDPTLLLAKEDYMTFFRDSSYNHQSFNDKIFCYILDMNNDTKTIIAQKSEELKKEVVMMGISSEEKFDVTLWLKSIYDAAYIITDSYHGVVFSLLFNKQFMFCGNARRGNSRVESLFRLLGVNASYDYSVINANIDRMRSFSIQFLKKGLTKKDV